MTTPSAKNQLPVAGGKRPVSRILSVPESILQQMAAFFVPYGQAGVETACYWFGVEWETSQVVTTLVLPRLFQSAGMYRVDTSPARRMAREMSAAGLVNLAQVHTHPPDCSVNHSRFDDEHAYSTREGALSLVWPDYGRSVGMDFAEVGVHERRQGRWCRLTAAQVGERIHLLKSLADYRWDILTCPEEDGDERTDFTSASR